MTAQILVIKTLSDILKYHSDLNGSNIAQRYVIDLSEYTKFVRPIFIVTLTQFIMAKRSMGYIFSDIIFDNGVSTRTSSYFKGIGFEEQFHRNFKVENLSDYRGYESSLPILVIPKEEAVQKTQFVIDYFRQQSPAKSFEIVKQYFDELINNCFDHSESPTGVVIHSQYYATNSTIKFAVCDTGKGIVKCVNDYHLAEGKEILSSDEAISWALTDSNTTKSTPRNRGRGLGILSSSLPKIYGEVWILTNDRCLFISQKEGEPHQKFHVNAPFIGTVFEFDIKIANLYDAEDDGLDFDLF